MPLYISFGLYVFRVVYRRLLVKQPLLSPRLETIESSFQCPNTCRDASGNHTLVSAIQEIDKVSSENAAEAQTVSAATEERPRCKK